MAAKEAGKTTVIQDPMQDMLLQRRLLKKKSHRPFDFDFYYNQKEFKRHTWLSRTMNFSPALATAFITYYQARFLDRHALFQPSHAALLRGLESRLTEEMTTFPASKSGFFVRMSQRSPKDGAPMDPSALRRDFEAELTRISPAVLSSTPKIAPLACPPAIVATAPAVSLDLAKYCANTIMVAFCGAQTKALCVHSSREAMCLLLSSERVYTDLRLALDCQKDADDEWETHLIVRQWDSELRHDWEFRCFVYEGRLNAVSQYNHTCVFKDVCKASAAEGSRALRREIKAYWESVRADIVPRSYVLDITRHESGAWRVIELNPFARTTGACMYDWSRDDALLHGRTDSTAGTERDGAAAANKTSAAAPGGSHLPPLLLREKVSPDLDEFVRSQVLPMVMPSVPDSRIGPSPTGSSKAPRPDPETAPWDAFLYLAEKTASAKVPADGGRSCCLS